MDFNQVAVFIKVVQAGSFSAAARLLDLPTSTVSNRVAMLEKRLGITLLQRTTRRLHLTDAGRIYFDHASAGLTHMLDAETAVTEIAAEPSGLLRVTAPIDLGDQLLASILRQMRHQHPKVQVEWVLTNTYLDLVAEGIDAAIRTGQLRDSTLVAKSCGIACWEAFARPDYLAQAPALESPQDLRHHNCVQFTPMGKDSWTFHNGSNSLSVPMRGQVMVNNIGVVHELAVAGEGVALLPVYLCRHSSKEEKLVSVFPEWRAKADPINIVYPRQRFMPPRLRAFIDLASIELRTWLE